MVTIAVPNVCPDEIGGCEDTDNDGLADTLYNWYWNSAGHYYFYNPNPVEDPDNWTATFLKDRKSTRLNSSHKPISYAVFCLKKKKKKTKKKKIEKKPPV